MELIVVQRRGALVVGAGSYSHQGRDGVGVASVVIDAAKHLIVTMTDGTTHDAGALPSSDEVEALAKTVSDQSTVIADLTTRLEELEAYHAVPTNALTTTSGEPLTDASGNYLTLGAVA